MTKPLNIEAPEFNPTRKVSKKTKQDLVASEAAEYYPSSLLREAVSIVNEKLKLDKKVECKVSTIREDKFEHPLLIPSESERALIGGELFDQISELEDGGRGEAGAGRNGDFPLREIVGGATVRTVLQQSKVREVLFILGVCRIRTALRHQTGGDDDLLQETAEDQFCTEENYRLRLRTESMMQEILKMRFQLGKLVEMIRDMKTDIGQMQMREKRNDNQRMVTMVPPLPLMSTPPALYETSRPTRRPEENPPIPTPMVGHLLNRRRLRDRF